MLEFIVLGQVPGTDIRLSFTVVLVIGIALLASTEFGLRYHRAFKRAKQKCETFGLYFAIIAR